jgi:hypothetical protein
MAMKSINKHCYEYIERLGIIAEDEEENKALSDASFQLWSDLTKAGLTIAEKCQIHMIVKKRARKAGALKSFTREQLTRSRR